MKLAQQKQIKALINVEALGHFSIYLLGAIYCN
jgi:hypothetical protein